jgi:hypothetical protein
MKKIEAVIKPFKLEAVQQALARWALRDGSNGGQGFDDKKAALSLIMAVHSGLLSTESKIGSRRWRQ